MAACSLTLPYSVLFFTNNHRGPRKCEPSVRNGTASLAGLVYLRIDRSAALQKITMLAEVDVFEVLLHRSLKCPLCVREKQRALDTLRAVGSRTFNECFPSALETQEIIGRVNEAGLAARSVVSGHRNTLN